MTNTIHPKTGGAAIGGALGVLLIAIANSIHGINIPSGVTDSIAAFLPVLGAYLTPSPDPVPAAGSSADELASNPPTNFDPPARAERPLYRDPEPEPEPEIQPPPPPVSIEPPAPAPTTAAISSPADQIQALRDQVRSMGGNPNA